MGYALWPCISAACTQLSLCGAGDRTYMGGVAVLQHNFQPRQWVGLALEPQLADTSLSGGVQRAGL